jgi:hypothetical protein
MLRAYQRFRDEGLKEPLDAAIGAICRRQSPVGGWGYADRPGNEPNLSVSIWQIESLKLAVALGWGAARPNLERGLRWIAGVTDDRGMFGYRTARDFPDGPQTLTAMGALSVLDPPHEHLISLARRQAIRAQLGQFAARAGSDPDYYRAYFLTAALKNTQAAGMPERLAAIRSNLLRRQVREGKTCGTWVADDQWGSVGGRLYATALASLSLR